MTVSLITKPIDHDLCMEGYSGKALKIEYLDFDHAFNRPFSSAVIDLISTPCLINPKGISYSECDPN